MIYGLFLKRVIDVIVSGCALLVLSIPLAIITMWLHIVNNGAGAFFFQERLGKGEKIFRICKFKSMTDEHDCNGVLLPDKERLTAAGRFIRSTSIDELPQLWNVLKGDMSLIGPRPLLTRYLPYYTEHERIRHTVRPGITGWAQVNGRSDATWNRKLACDVEYVENLSFGFDCKILWRTIFGVLKRESVGVAPTGDSLDAERKLKGIKNDILDKRQ